MAKSQADLDATLAQLNSDVATLVTAVEANSAAIATLKAAIAASGNTDFTNEVNALTQSDQAVAQAAKDIGTSDAP